MSHCFILSKLHHECFLQQSATLQDYQKQNDNLKYKYKNYEKKEKTYHMNFKVIMQTSKQRINHSLIEPQMPFDNTKTWHIAQGI